MRIEDLVLKKEPACTGCYACYSICPKEAVHMQPNTEGFLYPVIDKLKCINCSACENVCPVLNPIKNHTLNNPKSFAAINNDLETRLNSSSGGLFTAIAQNVINNNGIVFGAKFADDFSVIHSWTNNLEGLKEFQGSKYVQSAIGDTYKECKAFLLQGKIVLYSATPCQIHGLKKYLGNEYENLITIDFICHGVPSNLLWQKYVKHREKKSASQTVQTAFRRKNNGWKQYELSFTFANGSSYCSCHRQDPYMKIFLTDIALRSSCYKCPFRLYNRSSDFTLADFWGIQEILPKFDDDKGTSLVLVNTLKGYEHFNRINKYNCITEPISIEKWIQNNRSFLQSPALPKKRNKFYLDLNKNQFEKILLKYTKEAVWDKISKFLGRLLRKVIRLVKKSD